MLVIRDSLLASAFDFDFFCLKPPALTFSLLTATPQHKIRSPRFLFDNLNGYIVKNDRLDSWPKTGGTMFRKEVRELIWVYFFVSLGGLLLHLRIHPPNDNMFNWVPAAFGVANAFVLPFLFNRPTTVVWAYLFAWATVVTGTVAMAYYSIITWAMPITIKDVILLSTLADILILMAKVPLAHKILRAYRREGRATERGGCAE
jgi:hypothetical protein